MGVGVGNLGRGIEDSCDIILPVIHAYIATTSSVPAVFHCRPNDVFELYKNRHAYLVAMDF